MTSNYITSARGESVDNSSEARHFMEYQEQYERDQMLL